MIQGALADPLLWFFLAVKPVINRSSKSVYIVIGLFNLIC